MAGNQLIRVDYKSAALIKALGKPAQATPRTAALALTQTAWEVKKAETVEMQRVFDRPTRWTLNSLFVDRASTSKLEARVYWREFAGKGVPAFKYLNPNIFGGERKQKRFEQALRLRGYIAAGVFLMPTKAVPLDQHGNVPSPLIKKVLSHLKANSEVGYLANQTARSKKRNSRKTPQTYFYGNPGDRGEGVWERRSFAQGRSIRPIFLATKSAPVYRPIYDPTGLAERLVPKIFPREMANAFEQAVAKAKT